MKLASRMDHIHSSGIRRVFDLAAKLKDPANLSIGQPDFPPPKQVLDAAADAIRGGFSAYTQTQGILELRQAVARKLKERNGIAADPENVLITSGVMGGITLAFTALIDPGDEFMMTDPFFLAYPHLVRLMEGVPVEVDTYPSFLPDIGRLKKALTERTKALVLNSPANPTGAVYPRSLVKKLAAFASSNDLLVISDEIYERFLYEGEHVSIGSLHEKTLTLNGFSKSHAVPGWRVGYATGPEELIAAMKKLQQYTFVCAPSFAQKALASTMDADIWEHVKHYREKRDRLCRELKGFRFTKPEGAFYLFPEAPGGDASAFVERAIQRGVLVIPGNVFSHRDTHFRISFAAPDREIERGIAVLRELAQARAEPAAR
ncbi:pyridoxal phosphate-dependent aminotransferase [Candidatus Woesearchaeota archaeon]|nr:pyridoxal phosphate-dependent aminotransferase [Candidatus Woesearchaeota archaeon]